MVKKGYYKNENLVKIWDLIEVRWVAAEHTAFVGHSIRHHKTVEHLGCQLDSNLSREVMASKVLKKINAKLKFLYR